MGFKNFWDWITFRNWTNKNESEDNIDDYEALSKSVGRNPTIDDPVILRDIVSQRDFEDSTIEKIEYAPNSAAREAWREDSPEAQREAKLAAKLEAKERKREEKERRREEKDRKREDRLAEQAEQRAIRAEREERRQEYLQDRRDSGMDDDDDSDFID